MCLQMSVNSVYFSVSQCFHPERNLENIEEDFKTGQNVCFQRQLYVRWRWFHSSNRNLLLYSSQNEYTFLRKVMNSMRKPLKDEEYFGKTIVRV
jgi:hypothetical protein